MTGEDFLVIVVCFMRNLILHIRRNLEEHLESQTLISYVSGIIIRKLWFYETGSMTDTSRNHPAGL